MTVLINTKFTPFRLSLGSKAPVQLYTEVINKTGEEKKLLYEIVLGNGLSLDKSGMKTRGEKRLEPLKAGEKKFFYHQIFASPIVEYGETPVTVRLIEPEDEAYEFVRKRYTKEITLTVER